MLSMNLKNNNKNEHNFIDNKDDSQQFIQYNKPEKKLTKIKMIVLLVLN